MPMVEPSGWRCAIQRRVKSSRYRAANPEKNKQRLLLYYQRNWHREKLRNRINARMKHDARDDLRIAEIKAKLLEMGVDLGSS